MSASRRFLNRLWLLLESRHFLGEVLSLVQGAPRDPDLPADRIVEQTADDEVAVQEAGWIWDLVRLAEELEHVATFGMIDPRGSTEWRNKDLDVVKARLQEISLDLVFYRRILEQAAELRSSTPLMERILDEISRAMEGPGYRFRGFREELMAQAHEYESTREQAHDDEESWPEDQEIMLEADVGLYDDRDLYPDGHQESESIQYGDTVEVVSADSVAAEADDEATETPAGRAGQRNTPRMTRFSIPLVSPEFVAQLRSSTDAPTMRNPKRTMRIYGDGGPASRGAMLLEFLGTGLDIEDRFRIAEEAKAYVYSLLKEMSDEKKKEDEPST